MKRLVQLDYYSTRIPVSGGQKRIAALRDGLIRLGYEVRTVEVFAWMEPLHADDFKFEPDDDVWARRFKGEYENRISTVLSANRRFGERVLGRVLDETDVLWLEQPFYWPFLRDAIGGSSRPTIVYSAHNVEWQVRSELARRGGVSPVAPLHLQEMECDLVRSADLVVCVSEPDRRWFEDAGARDTVLVRNGSDPPASPLPSTRSRFRSAHGIRDNAVVLLYISAYWESNWLGLADWCLDALEDAAREHDVRLLLVGGIGIRMAEADLGSAVRDLIITTGEVDEAQKDAAYAAADAVLLPVVAGGGTNLKSAEALLSGLPVIASARAMRGFEALGDLDGVEVVPDKAGFSRAMIKLVAELADGRTTATTRVRRAPDDRVRALCGWEGALRPLGAALEQALAR